MTILQILLQALALVTSPPGDWNSLPPLRLSTHPDYALVMTRYIRDEVAAGRCTAPAPVDGQVTMKLDLAVLVSASAGEVLRVVPRAIHCPTVEQFAAGVVQKAARNNLAGVPSGTDGWYHTGMTITWAP